MTRNTQKNQSRWKGIVQYYDSQKGFGIIEGEADLRAIRVHKKDLDFLTLLHTGDEVEYEIAHSEQGQRAINIKICRNVLFRSPNKG